jgi:peptidoglycan/xylan/chitin deacetylase (PgdA/CDA1 family)
MIGVVADSSVQNVVSEFFELFKTPWEFWRPGRRYDVVISAGGGCLDSAAKLVVCYSAQRTPFDDAHQLPVGAERKGPCTLAYRGAGIPIYAGSTAFPGGCGTPLAEDRLGECLAYLQRRGESALARVGYDLFNEVRMLLVEGQPPANAGVPALDFHIALLRDLITGCGIPLVEVPPVPEGYPFIVCLTHDVDHPSIRRHKCDHTVFGFLHRAVFGSLRSALRGRISFRAVLTNWAAALKLPFVQLGFARDFWADFVDRYREVEKGLRSTFFIIPFSNRRGKGPQGPAPRFRASKYSAKDIAGTLQRLQDENCEIGLHGIDAWCDSARGREELDEIRRVTGAANVGVRMHWLYYDSRQSPCFLEQAGAGYDSTVGYNEMVGYRAGTAQAYLPPGAAQLLELPLHVMDSALFYPDRLALSASQAKARLNEMVKNAILFGGCLTINWHDRSLAPERLWGAAYRELVDDLKKQGAWFATAGEAVAWFRKRRSVGFEPDGADPESVRAKVAADRDQRLPGLRMRIHRAREANEMGAPGSPDYIDTAVDENCGVAALCGAHA